jgi:hypothetical protein
MTKIEQQVMASVAVIYAVRKLTSRFAFEVYALVLSLAGVATLVSLSHVAANFLAASHAGPGGVSTFTLSAVLGTKLIVQLALLVGGIAAVALVVDMVKGAATPRRYSLSS